MTAVPDFIPENDLERAMVAAAEDGGRFGEFLAALRAADIFLPGRETLDTPHQQPITDDEEIVLPVVDWQGQESVPVFSSLTRLQAAVPDAPSYMAFHFSDLAEAWGDHWMILNPGNPVGLPLSPAMIRGETDRLTIPAGSEVIIGEPAAVDPRVTAAIAARAQADDHIAAAHVAEVILSAAAEKPQLVVGIEVVAGADAEPVLSGMLEELTASGTAGSAGVVLVDRADPNAMARWMLDRDQPVYRSAR
jgi:hypothetical protein